MLRIGLSVLLACFPPSYVSRSDDDWFDYMHLSCGNFLFTSDGPTWTSIGNIELKMGESVETLFSGADIEKGSKFAGVDLWQILKNPCGPNMYQYAIYVSYNLSPKLLFAAETSEDGKKNR